MFLIDGRPGSTIPVQDRGLSYGDGVFETIAVHAGEPLLLSAHLDRLALGCRTLGITPPDSTLLQAECMQVATRQTRAVIKVIVTRGSGGRGYQPAPDAVPLRIVALHPWPDYPAERRDRGVVALFCATRLARQPALAGIKHLNRLEQVLGRRELIASDCAEGIMLDTDDNVVAGTMSNVFVVRDGRLLTPRLDQCGIAGIVRAAVLARCRELDLPAEEGTLRREDVLAADEVFFTNSILGLWPVLRIGSRDFTAPVRALRAAELLVSSGCIAPA